jgi:TIR domain
MVMGSDQQPSIRQSRLGKLEARMDQKKSPLEIFVSYSHKDDRYRERLVTQLSTMRQLGLIAPWHDREIPAGEKWQGQLDSQLNRAHIILLLVSADFIESEYCYKHECVRAIERHDAGDARAIPIILKPCDWQETPFGKLQALPTDGKPVTKWRPHVNAFDNIAKGLRAVVAQIQSNGTSPRLPKTSEKTIAKTSPTHDDGKPAKPEGRRVGGADSGVRTSRGPVASPSTRPTARAKLKKRQIFRMSDFVGRWKMDWNTDDTVLDLRKNRSWNATAEAGIGYRGFYKDFRGHWAIDETTNKMMIIQTHYRLAGIWLKHEEHWCDNDEIQSISKRAITFVDGSKLVRVD